MLHIFQNDPQVPPGTYGDLLRELQIPFRLVELHAGAPLPHPGEVSAAIVLGGRMGVHDETEHPFLRPLKRFLLQAAQKDIPLLGICLGGQLLAEVLGGMVTSNCRGEKGLVAIDLTPAGRTDPLFAELPSPFLSFAWHNDSFTVPPDATHLAATPICPGQAFRRRNAWGLQFHPEVDEDIVKCWSREEETALVLLSEFRRRHPAYRKFTREILGNFLSFL